MLWIRYDWRGKMCTNGVGRAYAHEVDTWAGWCKANTQNAVEPTPAEHFDKEKFVADLLGKPFIENKAPQASILN